MTFEVHYYAGGERFAACAMDFLRRNKTQSSALLKMTGKDLH